MFCAISGNPPTDPVISKYGHLFERSLIEKHLALDPTCPVTKEPLSKDDLISVKASKTVKPRPDSATSVPGLLALFQNEWDALMLETYTLKQHLDTVRQELSHALYQHDAASRVIARLIKERDQARQMLASLRSQYNIQESDIRMMDATQDEGALLPSKPPPHVVATTTKAADILSNERKAKKDVRTVTPVDKLVNFSAVSSHNVHKSRPKPGVTCLAIHPSTPFKTLTGGADNQAVIFSREEGVIAELQGHSNLITDVAFHLSNPSVLTASLDHTAILWTSANGQNYELAHKFTVHTQGVSSVSMHPTGSYAATASLDGSWALHDLVSARSICRVVSQDSRQGYRCAQFHPDGLIYGTGTFAEDGQHVVRIWDVNHSQNVATFEGHTDSITALSFSENGYYLATASEDGTVKFWDLRYLKNIHTINIGSPVHSVKFDFSGSYLAVGSSDVRVFANKTWELLTTFDAHKGDVMGVGFGPNASFLCSASMDQSIKFYGSS